MIVASTANNNAEIRCAAKDYLKRGWSVIPLPFRSKKCTIPRWQQLRLKPDEVDTCFAAEQHNIGVLLGEPSGWLIDVDLDHPRAVELAPKFLPPTRAIFGRPCKPQSHWLYRTTRPTASKKWASKSAGMLLEIRSTGTQTVFPPSVHESGEPICWLDEEAEPAQLDGHELLEVAKKLAHQIKAELGEKQASPVEKSPLKPESSNGQEFTNDLSLEEKISLCVRAMNRLQLQDHHDGSRRLFAAACRCVEFDLDEAASLRAIQRYSERRPFRKAWSTAGILQRIGDAAKVCDRGKALRRESNGNVALGSRDPLTGKIVLSAARTLPTAESFVEEFCTHPAGSTLIHYAGLLMKWNANRYVEVEPGAANRRLQSWLHEALRYVYCKKTNKWQLTDFQSNPTTVRSAFQTICNHVHLPALTPCPSWLGASGVQPPPAEIVACRSQLLHLPTMKSIEPTPRFFTTNALDFDPDPTASDPANWLEFLNQLFGDDIESRDLLQQWFGYTLVGDTSQQKMLLIVGPRRSGKGTIARVLQQIVGPANVCGPTTSSLAGTFGLQPLIGKSLAIVSDARFSGENISTVVERLLCISGEDQLTIDRKNITSVTLRLPTRFMFLTNEFPKLSDSSGALAGRFLILKLTESFYGKEDVHLTDRLLEEKPGILNWAIEGWHRLREQGHFVVPESALEAAEAIQDLSSPAGAFVRQLCEIGSGYRVPVDELYEAWRHWCLEEGRQAVTTRQSFGRDLAAAVVGISRRRGTNNITFYEGVRLK